MTTPFDEVIEDITQTRYHNHRLERHSDIISKGVFRDLIEHCESLRTDYNSGIIHSWPNVKAPGNRGRKIDLLIGECSVNKEKPDLDRVRIVVENKSVITAHRNRDARFDDLMKVLEGIYRVKKEAVIIATILVGLSERVLNIPDQVKKIYKGKTEKFESDILPRLSSGDESLWEEFDWAISNNRKDDPKRTFERFQELPTRKAAHTHKLGYDYVIMAPVYIDNVNPPCLARSNEFGIDIENNFEEMISHVCDTYRARWHL